MLHNLNTSMESSRRVVRQNRLLTLRDNIAMINLLIDIVNCATGRLFPGHQRLFPCFEPGKFGQKRWMNVYNAAAKRLQHRRFQNAHETGENYKLNTGLAKHSQK